MDLSTLRSALMILGAALFLLSAWVCRSELRPTWRVSEWQPIWKMRGRMGNAGWKFAISGLLLFGASAVLAVFKMLG
ncbi:hypothetical protein DRQ53_05945 [bacterium]|nr:MAG: hypothetical protein DRQ32_00980 [bacterium]RKZ16593.1 MAG: hypothetical protein DRQ53_05945 [bacterium]